MGCEADGECGTDHRLNNCGAHDGYRKATTYDKIHSSADCCRNNGANVGSYGGAPNPQDCESGCTANPQCMFFSHSKRWDNCVFCSECDLETGGSSKKYTSWAKAEKD